MNIIIKKLKFKIVKMLIKSIKFSLFFWISNIFTISFKPYSDIDVTVVGSIRFADGLGRLTIGFIEYLNNDLKISLIPTNKNNISFEDISENVKKIIKTDNKKTGNVAILFDPIWYKNRDTWKFVPEATIKIAYSMIESTKIPNQWVKILNSNFDAVVVPSSFLVDIYKNSGVKIPIFTLPHGIYLNDFLKIPTKNKSNYPFVFGMSAAFWPRKNHISLLKAFIKEFGNDSNVVLKLHGRFGDEEIIKKIRKVIQKNKIRNVKLISKKFSQKEYISFLQSIDCYVCPSKGEGYSVTPREAMALAVPCIITDNTAHSELCKTGFPICIPSHEKKPADYRKQFGCYCGYNFNCQITDIQKALRLVYEKYPSFLNNAKKSRKWIRQFVYENLKKKYLNLVKPKYVSWGTQDLITDEYLITTSKNLYLKYKIIQIYSN